ncbi:MAG TPA: hypothetical protein VMI75_27565 [Polyangiaceae bacterium]|nr:hypothetical protein [Polyangiaceae bacterium]
MASRTISQLVARRMITVAALVSAWLACGGRTAGGPADGGGASNDGNSRWMDCSCPSATCSCGVSGSGSGGSGFERSYDGCPSCTSSLMTWSLCGFPSP